MRKILVCVISLILICFSLPIIFTTRRINAKETLNENTGIKKEEEYDYKQYNTISLLHKNNNEIKKIKLDEYLFGVVASEMPASFEKEALKAQAVVARTYTIYKITNNDKKHGNADICDDFTCCQAWISKQDRLEKWEQDKREEYWNKIVEAVNSTQGKIITYEGKPINAFFHSNSGGSTEAPVNVWGGTGYPYLQTVTTSGEDTYNQYSSELEVNKEDFINKIKQEHSNFEIDFNKKDCIKITEYTDGNRVKNIAMGNLNLSGVEVRNIFGLKSANFKITIEKEKIKFEVIGYGHGVGMSQTGADSLAKHGKNYEEIIKHYYTNVELENM